MKNLTAFWNILLKDMRTYYLKPPNISWGIIFPLAWTAMFFIKSGAGRESLCDVLPGVVALSVLFGTTSLLSVTVTFEKRNRSFERLLLAPVPLNVLLLAKTGGAILFGAINAAVPLLMAVVITDLPDMSWGVVAATVLLIAVSSTFMGLFITVSVSEVFEAQTFSNFFRFPMVFLCGLFFPVARLPALLKPVAYLLPLTYGADALHAEIRGAGTIPVWASLAALALFCAALFAVSLHQVKRKWIA